jgi:putative addiction module component (TIGR02574 family)
MAQPLPMPPPGFDELDADEKLRYVSAIWDRVVAEQETLQLSEGQRLLLRERLASHKANPGVVQPWSEVRREIEAQHRATLHGVGSATTTMVPSEFFDNLWRALESPAKANTALAKRTSARRRVTQR